MSAHLEQLVEALLRTDLAGLDVAGLQQHAVAVRRVVGQLTGHLNGVLGELADRQNGLVADNGDADGSPRYRPVQHWWRDAVTLTGQQAAGQVRHASVLRDLPVIASAVLAGDLAPEQARVLGRLHGNIPLPDLQESQPLLVQVARGMDTEALGKWVAHLIATHCEPGLEADQARARARRYLQLRTEHDGTVRGSFLLASEDAEAVLTVLEPLARRQGLPDTRSAGQRRADALVEVFAGAASWMDLPHAGGQRVQLSYVLDAEWAAGLAPPTLASRLGLGTGLSTSPDEPAHGQSPREVHPHALFAPCASGAWTGPQTRARIETALCDARLSRVLLDASGQVQSLISVTDQITTAQRRAVSARDRQCIAKGCTRPPAFCDVHHLLHRADGGATTVENLGLLCRRHHVLWHRGLIGLHDLHAPWLPDPEGTPHAPWDQHNPPLVA